MNVLARYRRERLTGEATARVARGISGAEFKSLRIEAGATVDELARVFCIPVADLIAFEAGTKPVTRIAADLIRRMAA